MTPEEGIRRTLALYCQLCDDGRFDEWAQLYVDDAELHVLGTTHRGRRAIQAFIERAQPPERRGKHLCANPVIDLDDSGTTAQAATDFVFVAHRAEGFAISSVGRYLDRLVLADGRWRFARREIVLLGGAAAD
ncbi:MAG: nuclear transport factor 2 family protein [Acidimicrobiales bacterium]|jgi:3-phenylpropionate/cinnamic acid dioxygenase small subunit